MGSELAYAFRETALTALCPVVTSTALAEYKVVGTEQTAEWAGAHGVHGPRLEVNQHRTGHIFIRCGWRQSVTSHIGREM